MRRIRVGRWRVALLVFVSTAVRTARPQDRGTPRPASVERVAGCYLLDAGAWEHDSLLALTPDMTAGRGRAFRLLAAPLAEPDSVPRVPGLFRAVGAVRTAPGPWRLSSYFQAWHARADSVRVVPWPPPFAGYALALRRAGRDLRGVLEYFNDDRSHFDVVRRAVYARRVPCGSTAGAEPGAG